MLCVLFALNQQAIPVKFMGVPPRDISDEGAWSLVTQKWQSDAEFWDSSGLVWSWFVNLGIRNGICSGGSHGFTEEFLFNQVEFCLIWLKLLANPKCNQCSSAQLNTGKWWLRVVKSTTVMTNCYVKWFKPCEPSKTPLLVFIRGYTTWFFGRLVPTEDVCHCFSCNAWRQWKCWMLSWPFCVRIPNGLQHSTNVVECRPNCGVQK